MLSLLLRLRWLNFIHESRELKKGFTTHLGADMQRALYYYLPSALRSAIRKRKRIGAGLLQPRLAALVESEFPGAENRRSYNGLAVESVKYGLQQLLRYEDRISMAFSIESRVPFLDHRFAEHVLRMKPEWLIKDGYTKYPLRRLGAGLVPDEIRWRRDKMGFLTPAGQWLVEKRSVILEFMHSTRIRSLIDVEKYGKLIGTDLNQPTHVSEAWKLFIMAKWLEVFDVSV
jgi:asparagine synthase (glutamine-hydrolysing)